MTPKHGLHHVWDTPEKQLGQIWHDRYAGCTQVLLYAQMSSIAPGQVILYELANTTASEAPGITTRIRAGVLVRDITLTNVQTVVQTHMS